MPRRPRFVLPGVAHHVTQRGNHQQNVFLTNRNRARYLEILAEHSHRHDLRILGWCLMTNHIHLIAIPGTEESMSLALGEAHSRYTLEVNRQQQWSGHLWQGRFHSSPLEEAHLMAALRYVDQNPVRAAMVLRACDWPWSSALAHTDAAARAPLLDWPWARWLKEARLGDWDYADWNARLAGEQPPQELDRIRRSTKLGAPLGGDAFVEKLEQMAGRRLRVWPQGRPPKKGTDDNIHTQTFPTCPNP